MPRPQRKAPPYDPAKVRALLSRQAGIVASRQLAALGVTDADIRRQVRRRVLFRLSRGVYSQSNGTPTALQRAWWACLHYGRAGVADESAIELARDSGGTHLRLPVHIAVASGRSVASLPQVALHHVSGLEAVIGWNGNPPRMQPSVAALRVASRQHFENDVVSALADAVNRRVTTATRMLDDLAGLTCLPQRPFIREVLVDLKDGACSVLERGYLRRVERPHGLPIGQRQAPRRTPEGIEFRDVEYEEYGLVVELVGRAFHSDKEAWDADLERDLDDLVATKEAARLGWRQVFGTPCRTAGKVARLFQRRGWGGAPEPCGPDCAVNG